MNFNKKTLSHSRKKVLSLDYYDRLDFGDIDNWSDEDITQFLIFDFLNAFENSSKFKKVPEIFLKEDKKLLRKYKMDKFIFYPIDCFLSFFYFIGNRFFESRKRGKKILFQNSRYKNIILEVKEKYHIGIIEQSRKERIFLRKDFSGHMDVGYFNHLTSCYLKERNKKYLYELFRKVEKRLKIIYPDYIVLGNDVFPVERAIVLASKKLGIKTIVIQSGLYDSATDFIDCRVADYVLMWGDHFKELYVENNIRNKKDIYILGYPYEKKAKSAEIDKNNLTVCYLGQDYERYVKEFLAFKIDSINRLSKICKNLNMSFIYRPHPNDDREFLSKKLSGIPFTGKKESLLETFEKTNIFVGVSSTALVQSAIYSKIALQIIHPSVSVNNFESLGIVSKSFKNMLQFKSYLEKIAKHKDLSKFKSKFNNNYIETRYDPVQKFLEIIGKIQ